MATRDPREQSRILAEHPSSMPPHQLRALIELGPGLKAVCESLPPAWPRDLADAILAAVAGDRLSREQRQALVAPLLATLAALAEDTVPLPRRLAVVGAEA